jgi:HAD superfamily hydrolase (TIGR01458 family)
VTGGLAGVRGLLLDLDGVIVLRGQAVPGAAAAIAELDRRGIPFRVVTNTSAVTPASLSRYGASIGIHIPPERILSGLTISAAYTARRHPGRPLHVLASEEARGLFAGQRLLDDDEAGRPGAEAAAVVIGDAPEIVSHASLNRAFRLIRGGAELIGMHKNPYWLTPDGETIDSGAIVAALEFATGTRATIVGKPSRAFFAEAADRVLADLTARDGGRRPPRGVLAMVGDDLRTDVLAAQRAGLRGAFVLSGKHGREELEALRRGSGRRRVPDGVFPSLAEVVAALD